MIVYLVVFVISLLSVWLFVKIRDYQLSRDPMLKRIRNKTEALHPAVKNIKMFKGSKSYTINKSRIYLCLKDEKGQYYNENMLIYVFIHELAHYLNKEDVGHTPKFFEIFNELINKAVKLGIYDDSIPPLNNYCGEVY